MHASVRIFWCGVLLAACVPIAGCDAGEGGGVLGTPPTTTVVHLVERSGEVTPAAAAAERVPRLLLRLDAEALSAWPRAHADNAVRFASPQLGTEGIADVGTLHLRLVPGGATRVAVIPHARETRVAREDRALRRIEISLERDADPDAPVEISLGLHEALYANLGDAGRRSRLAKLELVLPGADPERAALESVVIERRSALPPDVEAAARVVDHEGVLRPSWVVRGGAAVELAIELPEGAPELRWSDGGLPNTGARSVSLVDGEDRTLLARSAPATKAQGAGWTPQIAELARWAGREVRLLLEVEGEGVGLFGDPTIVAGRDPSAPDVLVYLIDTLRGDHLGVAAPDRPPVSPTLDRLARDGVWFRRAQSSSPWTKPAVATLFSGILPTTHRVGATSYTDRMPGSVPLVQETFREASWRTASFSASPLGSTLSALERGFGAAFPPRFWRAQPRLGMNPAASQLHEALLDWVDEQPDRAFFAYVHTLEVHEWKLARYQNERPAGFSAYDAAILDADLQLAALLEGLAERRGNRDLLLVVVSDHGESWGDHGLPSHGFGLHQSQIHIPLIFWKSGGKLPARVVDTPVSLADLAPTLLEGFGLPPLDPSDGRELSALLRGDELERGPVLSSLLRFVWAPGAPRQYAVTTPERLVRIRNEGGPDRSYDLVIDPLESKPLPEPATALDEVLDSLLAAQREGAADFEARHGPIRPAPVTADESARLRALGYLEPIEHAPPMPSPALSTPHEP